MNPISRKAGGTLLLVLALAPGLAAGGKMSRTLATAAGAYAAATTRVPASAADLAPATPAGASAPVAAPGLWTPYGPVSLKPMAYLCPGPALDPSPDTDLETVEALAKAATQAYGDAGCEPLLAGKLPCIGPDAWEPPAGARTLSADAFIDARLGVQPQYDHAGYPAIRGLHDATAWNSMPMSAGPWGTSSGTPAKAGTPPSSSASWRPATATGGCRRPRSAPWS
jgi:hypothetical protein